MQDEKKRIGELRMYASTSLKLFFRVLLKQRNIAEHSFIT
jgi:hypothetical protein